MDLFNDFCLSFSHPGIAKCEAGVQPSPETAPKSLKETVLYPKDDRALYREQLF